MTENGRKLLPEESGDHRISFLGDEFIGPMPVLQKERITEIRIVGSHPAPAQMIKFMVDGRRLVSVGAGYIRRFEG